MQTLGSKILVKPHPSKTTTDGGLELTTVEKPLSGEVVCLPIGYEGVLNVGDTVFFGKYGHIEIPINDEVFYIFGSEDDLYSKL